MSRPRYTKNLYRGPTNPATENLVGARERAALLGFRVVERQPDPAVAAARARMLADRQAGLGLRLTALDFVDLDEVEALLMRLGA